MKTIRAWWSDTPKPGNLGDVLTKPILEKLGYKVERVGRGGSLLGIGSIARFARKGNVVWGSGMIDSSDRLDREARWLAVRGPITGEKVGCDVYGDPALLCSRLWKPYSSYEVWGPPVEEGVVPHYVDFDKLRGVNEVISPLSENPVDIARTIGSCGFVISSSLHGIIVAHSYGVPAGWWRPSDRLTGDDVKFRDYAESMGITLTPSSDMDEVDFVCPDREVVKATQGRLIGALNEYMETR